MLEAIMNWLAKVFAPATYQSELEDYLVSKNPQTPGDVDHWLAQYDDERRTRARFLADNGY